MTDKMKLTISLCLFAVSCVTLSEAFRQSINDHLIKSCSGYFEKKRGEGNRCNSEVLDHVHDFAEGVRGGAGYSGDMVEKYLKLANNRGLCYLEGSDVRPVMNGCAAMELVCDPLSPKFVDRCSQIRKSIPPPTLPPTTQRPTTKATAPVTVPAAATA